MLLETEESHVTARAMRRRRKGGPRGENVGVAEVKQRASTTAPQPKQELRGNPFFRERERLSATDFGGEKSDGPDNIRAERSSGSNFSFIHLLT